jgi:ABC-type lipoprotein release transport system permease subunit
MRFSWFLALRYLKPKRTFLSIITVISIAGVALGVGVLIVVIAVMSGFEKRIKDEWLKVEPPLYLHDGSRSFFTMSEDKDGAAIAEWRELLPKVVSFPGVENAAPFLNVVALIQQAVPKEHDTDSVTVDELPPDTPPPPEPPPSAPPSTSEGSEGTETGQDSPGSGEPADPPSAKDAVDPPPRDKKPPVSEPADPERAAPNPAADEPPDPNAPAPAPGPAVDPEPREESVTGLDRSRPLTHVMLIGVDTENVRDFEKRRQRFEELKRTTGPPPARRPFAEGEFDLAGDSIVLCMPVVEKLYQQTGMEFPFLETTTYNIFGPAFINEGIDIIQENSEAKDDPVKKEEVARKDRDYPLPGELRFTGVFNDEKQQSTGMQAIGYVSLKTAQTLSGAGNAVDGIAIELEDPYDAPEIARKLDESGILPEGWHTETWIQRHRQQFEAVANERSMMYIVLAIISVVAAFSMMNTMITFAVQKRREIGMMRALGAKTSQIVSLFLTKGFIVGLLGTALGYGLGRLVLFFRNDLRSWINEHFGHQIFDSSIYGLNEIPASLRTLDEVIICAIGLSLCTLSALIPALLVGRMSPARALRNDR